MVMNKMQRGRVRPGLVRTWRGPCRTGAGWTSCTRRPGRAFFPSSRSDRAGAGDFYFLYNVGNSRKNGAQNVISCVILGVKLSTETVDKYVEK